MHSSVSTRASLFALLLGREVLSAPLLVPSHQMGELKVTQLSTNANSLTEGQSSKAAEDSTSSQITLIIIVCCTSVGIIFLIIVGWFLCRRYYKRRLRGNGMTAEDKYARQWQKKYMPGSTIVRSRISSVANPKQNVQLSFAPVSVIPPVPKKKYKRNHNCVIISHEKSKMDFKVPWAQGSKSVCILSTTRILPSFTLSHHNNKYNTAYFEVTIVHLSSNANARIAFGFSSKPYPCFRLPGWNPNSAAIHSNDGAIHASFLKDKLLRLSAEGAKRPLTPGDTLGCGYVVKAGASATSLVNFFFTLNGEIVCFKDDISGGDMTNMYACVGSDCDAELSYNFRGGFKCLAVSHFMHSAKKGDSMNTSFQQFSSVHSIPTYETEGEQ